MVTTMYEDGHGFVSSTTPGYKVPVLTKSTQAYQSTIVGVISNNYTDFGSVGNNIKDQDNPYPVALVGRVPVKISTESGPIKIGDRITSSSLAGVGMKATTSGVTVGIALEPFDGSTATTSATVNGQEIKTGTILVFVNLGQSQLAASQGTIDLTTLNSDLNLNGFSLLNVKSILGANGLWKIDEGGNIIAQSVETQKLTVGGGAASGVTVYDRQTTAPKCIYIEGGVIKTSDGACGSTLNPGLPAIITPASAPAPTATAPVVATTTPDIVPIATSTPAMEPVVATTTEPFVATTTAPVIVLNTATTTATTTP